jgi:hypothetical protein
MQQYGTPSFRTKLVPGFWHLADEARRRFEQFMGNPQSHTFSGPHQCWDFWYMPNVYCYLRTDPVKVLGRDLVEDFMRCLNTLARSELERTIPTAPWMTLHLNGMRHEVHNDSCNGTYAYIFSLIPDLSTFTGGQTIIIGTVDEIETTSTIKTGTTIGIGTMGPWAGYCVCGNL